MCIAEQLKKTLQYRIAQNVKLSFFLLDFMFDICEPLSQQIINYSKWSIYLSYCFLRSYPKYLHIFVPTRLMRVK